METKQQAAPAARQSKTHTLGIVSAYKEIVPLGKEKGKEGQDRKPPALLPPQLHCTLMAKNSKAGSRQSNKIESVVAPDSSALLNYSPGFLKHCLGEESFGNKMCEYTM